MQNRIISTSWRLGILVVINSMPLFSNPAVSFPADYAEIINEAIRVKTPKSRTLVSMSKPARVTLKNHTDGKEFWGVMVAWTPCKEDGSPFLLVIREVFVWEVNGKNDTASRSYIRVKEDKVTWPDGLPKLL